MNKFKDCNLLHRILCIQKGQNKDNYFGLNYQRGMCTSVATIARFLGSKIIATIIQESRQKNQIDCTLVY